MNLAHDVIIQAEGTYKGFSGRKDKKRGGQKGKKARDALASIA
jgi:hypothetical protein